MGKHMAKLTLSFKDRILKVFTLTSDTTKIGRDKNCTIPIDSLAIEPQHAIVRTDKPNSFVVEPISEQTVILVNGSEISEAHRLLEGDIIQVGKHTFKFTESDSNELSENNVVQLPSIGWLQIQSGSHLGRTIRLDKAFTRIGKPDEYLAVLAHREDGYIVSHLHGNSPTCVNNQDIGDLSCKLTNGDQINIGMLQAQFFSDGQTFQQSAMSPAEPQEQKQRVFSRVNFNVSVTVYDGEQSWETDLIDISLHGALIQTPQEFKTSENRQYRIVIHLEGGPDINMDAHVAHFGPEHIGLQCDDIDVDSITHLRRLIELNLGDSELLERELAALG